jgi:hypothetical protein
MKLTYKSNKREHFICLLTLFSFIGFTSCKKFLDEKPKQSLVVPQTLTDLQSMLDNSTEINSRSASNYSEVVADNFYLEEGSYQAYTAITGNPIIQGELQSYLWTNPGLPVISFWLDPYQSPIYYSNIILDQLSFVTRTQGDEIQYNAIKGSALFCRAFQFHVLAQLYCRPYGQEYLNEPGIVLRLTSDINTHSARATVEQTYDRIIMDLKEAADLLPIASNLPTRPSKIAAYAELARVYLTMRDYSNAGIYAYMALQMKSDLLDYNSLNLSGDPIISKFNTEVIFHDMSSSDGFTGPGAGLVDTTFYNTYASDDLRKEIFFKNYGTPVGTYSFGGSYDGQGYNVFDGLATDELFIIRAECSARAGNKDSAMADLNRLLQKRWKNTVAYVKVTATDATDALSKVLIERRKELIFRGLRWSDVRRFNLEGANITLRKNIAGIIYTLPPNDKRTVMLIPFEEITRSGIEQNPR